jgi:hypothetical protein
LQRRHQAFPSQPLLRRSAAQGVVGLTEPASSSPPVPARNRVRSHSPRWAQVIIGRLGPNQLTTHMGLPETRPEPLPSPSCPVMALPVFFSDEKRSQTLTHRPFVKVAAVSALPSISLLEVAERRTP